MANSSLPNMTGQPVVLAPLAGVSDAPFRIVCQDQGADLTYVEMLSAAALIHENKRTLGMCYRHPDEPVLGVQVTGRNAQELADGIPLKDLKEQIKTHYDI